MVRKPVSIGFHHPDAIASHGTLTSNSEGEAIGILTAGMSQRLVAQALNVHATTIFRLRGAITTVAERSTDHVTHNYVLRQLSRTVTFACNTWGIVSSLLKWLQHGFLAAITTGSAIRLCPIAFGNRGVTAVVIPWSVTHGSSQACPAAVVQGISGLERSQMW